MRLWILPDGLVCQVSPEVGLDRATTALRYNLMHIYFPGKCFMHRPVYLHKIGSNVCDWYRPQRCFLPLFFFLPFNPLLFCYRQCFFQSVHSLKLIGEVRCEPQSVCNLAFCNLTSTLLDVSKTHNVAVLLFLDALGLFCYIFRDATVCNQLMCVSSCISFRISCRYSCPLRITTILHIFICKCFLLRCEFFLHPLTAL